jgi:hypothetical protein
MELPQIILTALGYFLSLAADRHHVNVCRGNTSVIQGRLYRHGWKSRLIFYPAEPFLLNSVENFVVFHDNSGTIKTSVYSENVHMIILKN